MSGFSPPPRTPDPSEDFRVETAVEKRQPYGYNVVVTESPKHAKSRHWTTAARCVNRLRAEILAEVIACELNTEEEIAYRRRELE